jgi:hypothetical protein
LASRLKSSAGEFRLLTPNLRAATLPPVTADPSAMTATPDVLGAAESDQSDEAGPLYCYRHPKSETYVRCGRCDEPICPKCAVQGPVGFRCRQCGLVKSASLSSFTPHQLVLGLAIPIGGGALLGFLGGQVGFYSIFIAFFAGAFLAEGFVRFVGMKRGPLVRGMLYGGLAAGFAAGAALEILAFAGSIVGEAEGRVSLAIWLQTVLPYALIGLGAMIAGAYSRVRWF